MPKRIIPLITGQIYHIFNRSIDGIPIFVNKNILQRTKDAINYYKLADTPVRLSYFVHWSISKKNIFIKKSQTNKNKNVILLAYCLMPNHFHLLLKQEADYGTSRFMSNFQNSITRYINTVKKQLHHVSRYIHLNPFSSYLIKNITDLKHFHWSSLKEYLNSKKELCELNYILSNFKNSHSYWKFIEDQSDYQRNLESIKHLILE